MHPNPDRLIRIQLFDGLSDADLDRIASWLDVTEHPAGTALTHEGTAGYAFFVLDSGEARVEHDGRVVGHLTAGEVFGELALLGDGHRRADVVATTDVRVYTMFGTRFREMQMSMPALAARLQEVAEQRLRELDDIE